MPGSIDEAEKCIVQSKLKRQKTLDSLHIDELTAEGKTINQLMNSSFSKLQDNPEFTSTLVTVQKLVDQITNIKSRLDLLWNSYHLKLETNLRKHKFKKDTEQVRVIFVIIILHTCAPFSFPLPPFLPLLFSPLPFPLPPLPFPFPLPPLPFTFPLPPLPFPFPLPPLPFPFPFLPMLLLLFLFQLSLSPIFHDLPSRTDRGVVRGVCR